jgi:large subunit ribosomal protein L24e
MKCAFCKSDFDIPYGVTIVQKDGSIKSFCSSKCRKNAQMGRDNRKVKWVAKMKHNKAKAEEKRIEKEARQEKERKEEKSAEKKVKKK